MRKPKSAASVVSASLGLGLVCSHVGSMFKGISLTIRSVQHLSLGTCCALGSVLVLQSRKNRGGTPFPSDGSHSFRGRCCSLCTYYLLALLSALSVQHGAGGPVLQKLPLVWAVSRGEETTSQSVLRSTGSRAEMMGREAEGPSVGRRPERPQQLAVWAVADGAAARGGSHLAQPQLCR